MANAALIVLHLMTFNFWGLPDAGFRVLAPLRRERAAAVCDRLKAAALDVVLMQEVWVEADRQSFRKCGFPYFVDEDDPRLPLDSGLLILSKYPLEQVARLTYPQSGDLSRLAEDGEAIARKSALVARVRHPQRPFWVANTHLVSYYTEVPADDAYLETRRSQFQAYAQFAREHAGKEPLLIGGDFNFNRESPLWEEIARELKGFHEAREAADLCTVCPPNTMHTHSEGKIDQLFASPEVEVGPGRLAMTEPLKVEDFEISVSDHWGWETEFRLPAPPVNSHP